MQGKKSRGRPRIGMLNELKEDSYGQMKKELKIEGDGNVGFLSYDRTLKKDSLVVIIVKYVYV